MSELKTYVLVRGKYSHADGTPAKHGEHIKLSAAQAHAFRDMVRPLSVVQAEAEVLAKVAAEDAKSQPTEAEKQAQAQAAAAVQKVAQNTSAQVK